MPAAFLQNWANPRPLVRSHLVFIVKISTGLGRSGIQTLNLRAAVYVTGFAARPHVVAGLTHVLGPVAESPFSQRQVGVDRVGEGGQKAKNL